jgi:dihydroorotase
MKKNLQQFEMPKLADMHVHLRHTDIPTLKNVVNYTAQVCEYAVVMPNTNPPTITAKDVANGRRNILTYSKYNFQPLMMMKMEGNCCPDLIRDSKAIGTKSYPEGVTTNSNIGLSQQLLKDPSKNLKECWEEQQANGMISSWHGEMPNSFVMDAEQDFLPFIANLSKNYPKLKIVLEHITTAAAVDLIINHNPHNNIAATITYHHLRMTLDDILKHKIRPHHYCKPVPKTPKDRESLLNAAFSGNPQFFLGSDSAPHSIPSKECSHGCAGVYTSPVLVQGLADLFDSVEKLDRLESFACRFGPEFYNLSPIQSTLCLERRNWTIPLEYNGFVPYHAGETLTWRLYGSS